MRRLVLASCLVAALSPALASDVDNPQTNASQLTTGTLPAGRLPALTGDVTSSAGSAATTLAAGSASNLNSGTLAAARGGAGTINGALKANGSGVVSQAACADLSNGATGCSTATGTSGATIPLLNGANTWSGNQTISKANGQQTIQDTGTSSALQLIQGGGEVGVRFGQEGSGAGGTLVTGSAAGDGVVSVRDNKRLVFGTNDAQQMAIAGGGGITIYNLGTGAGNGAMCGATNIVNGTGGALTYDSGANCIVSLRSAKTDIRPIASALSEVMRLRPIEFRYRPGFGDGGEREQVGLIAEDAAAVDPRLAAYDEVGELRGVRYAQSVALLVRAIQELKSDNDTLRVEIDQLRAVVGAGKHAQ